MRVTAMDPPPPVCKSLVKPSLSRIILTLDDISVSIFYTEQLKQKGTKSSECKYYNTNVHKSIAFQVNH